MEYEEAKKKGFRSQLEELIRYFSPDMILLLERKVQSGKTLEIIKTLIIQIFFKFLLKDFQLGFGYYVDLLITFSLRLSIHHGFIHGRIHNNNKNISWLSTFNYGYSQQHLQNNFGSKF